jgi:hypothetical protein
LSIRNPKIPNLEILRLRLAKLPSQSSMKSVSSNGVLITQLTIHLRPIELFEPENYVAELEGSSKASEK